MTIRIEIEGGQSFDVETDDPELAKNAARRYLATQRGEPTVPASTEAAMVPPPPEPEIPTQPEPPGRSMPMMLGQAVGRGISDTVNTPLDLMSMPLNVGMTGLDWAGQKFANQPFPQRFMPSEIFARKAGEVGEAAGLPVVDTDPHKMPVGDTAAYNATKFGTMGLLGDIALRAVSKGRAPIQPGASPRYFDDLFRAYQQTGPVKTAIGGTVAGAGAGTALTGTQQIPEEIRQTGGGAVGAVADLAAMFAGGVGGGTLASTVMQGPRAAWNRFQQNRPARDIPLDENSMAVSNRTRDATADWLQGITKTPADDAANIDRNRAWVASNIPTGPDGKTPMPSTFLMSDNPHLEGLDSSLRQRSPGQFIESDNAVREGARGRIDAIRTPGANQPGGVQTSEFPDTAANIVRERQATADQRVASAQDQVTATDMRSRQEATAVGGQYAGDRQRQAATQADEAYTTQGYLPAREEKNRQFNEAPGRDAVEDVQPILDRVSALRGRVNELGPERLQISPEFMQRLERLAPDMQPGEGGAPPVNVGGDNTARVGDLADLRKYLNTATEKARAGGNFDLATSFSELRREINQFIERHPGYADANQNYRQFADTYRPGPNDAAAKFTRKVDRDPTRSATPPSETVPSFLTGSAEDAAALRRGMPAQGVEPTVDWMMGDLARSGAISDGRLSVTGLQRWRRDNADTISAFPEINQRIDNLIGRAQQGDIESGTAQRVLQDQQASRRNVERDTTQGPLGVVTSGGKDADHAVAAVFGGGNAPRNMTRLRDEMQRSDERGAQRAFDDARTDLNAQEQNLRDVQARRQAGNATPADVTDAREHRDAARTTWTEARDARDAVVRGEAGPAVASQKAAVSEWLYKKVTDAKTDQTVKFADLSKLMKDHEQTLVAAGFTPSEMNSLRAGQKFLEFLSKRASQATVGSPTAENLSRSWALFEVAAKVWYGGLRGGNVTRNAKLLAKTVVSPGSSQVDQMWDLALRAATDPELATKLLRRDTPKPAGPAWNPSAARAQRRLQVGRDIYGKETPPDEE